MSWRESILDIAAAATALCTVTVTAVLFLHPSSLPVLGADGRLGSGRTAVPGWQELVKSGHRIGPKNAALTIVEFGDFECPYCARYALTLDSVRAKYPKDFAFVFHHFPLNYHRLAYPLARAAECAADQDRFAAFYDTVYEHQARLLSSTPGRIGLQAGIPDSTRYTRCVDNTARVPSIDSDLVRVRTLGVPGTPAIIVAGALYARSPSAAELESMVAKSIRSRSP